jgi:membrane-associated protease RseP (regulator of RpoE activity)
LPNDNPSGSTAPAPAPDWRTFAPAAYEPPVIRHRFQDRRWLHVLLLFLTLLTTSQTGVAYYLSFLIDFGSRPIGQLAHSVWLYGLWYALPVLLILGAHEMGHYLQCRRYNVDASLPFFIPAPIGLTGTLGAVIRIRESFPNRTALFDIGVAGPIAGFVVLVPVLFIGLALSNVRPIPPNMQGLAFGEPLLFKLASWLMFGPIRNGLSLNAHPMVFAAWFGMLATSLNLLPFGQLDGGHLAYATLGRRSTSISILTAGTAIVMTFVSTSWLLFTVIILVMLLMFGPRHPSVRDELEPLGPGRIAVAIFAVVMLILCFTPVPIDILK